jgi:hypothetical protein
VSRKRRRSRRQARPAVSLGPAALAAAEREAARNKALIEAGETFAGQKPSDWRRGRKRQEPAR